MALNFPNNPTVGDLYQTGSSAEYKYTAKGYWEVVQSSPLEFITAMSSSYALTASYALNGGGGGPVDGVVTNTTDTYTGSPEVRYIVSLTQAQYDLILSKDPNTLYVVV